MTLRKIISGGQTGVDRGALDAALALRFPCGGWCPQGRLAEDGPIAETYPLAELPKGGYLQRTIRNVADSDGTLIIFYRRPEGGTAQTLAECIKRRRPYLLIDAAGRSAPQAAETAARFVADHAVAVLNVAGPRASKAAAAYAYSLALVTNLLRAMAGDAAKVRAGP